MRIVLFCHTLRSDWNHGNAHFLRGVVTELVSRGHEVKVYEPEDSWSYRNLIAAEGQDYGHQLKLVYPSLEIHCYSARELDLDRVLADSDVVLVHEWTEATLIRRIAEHRQQRDYLLLFHDTHHRSVSDPAMAPLDGFDGVLAFGESVSKRYRASGWGQRVWTWHEAADTRVFYPRQREHFTYDVLWIGNWGDEERTAELREFFVEPVRELGLRAKAFGVRYPVEGLELLERAGIEFGGWAPNFRVPELYSQAKMTLHIPRRPYVRELPGVPTIRVFEALACGIPLISAPWDDSEGLFAPGEDFLSARDGRDMKELMRMLLRAPSWAAAIAEHGRRTILARHTCGHRVDELLNICDQLRGSSEPVHDSTYATGARV